MTHVRRVTADDWREWRRVRLRSLREDPTAFGSTYERESAFSESDFRSRLGADQPAFLAYDESTAIGMGAGHRDAPGRLRVVAMWTAPEARGRGVGRAVLHAVVEWARARDLAVHLDVEVGNAAARALYESYGFEASGQLHQPRPGEAMTCVEMDLPLSGG